SRHRKKTKIADRQNPAPENRSTKTANTNSIQTQKQVQKQEKPNQNTLHLNQKIYPRAIHQKHDKKTRNIIHNLLI
ncbi:hypothetical protein AKJ50_02240, partial [candidate division MSBL1 archaeon SCGC-AAA382A13]